MTAAPLIDRHGRGIDDLRISIIDRCNFRCSFCMPGDRTYEFLPREQLLTYEEIARLVRVFASLGVRKVRLTGGEPLLRADVDELIRQLRPIPGIEDLALTTNGALLAERAAALAAAGLDRVTVSLESLDDETFGRINGVGFHVAAVLEGISAAERAGLRPIKVNTVVMRGVNDHEVVDIAAHFKALGHVVRFIEFMDVGTVNGWGSEQVLSAREILDRIDAVYPLERIERERTSDTALRYRYRDDGVEVGAIASITEPFCGSCTRARLTSDGKLFTCLFASQGVDLKAALRQGVDDFQLEQLIRDRWQQRTDRYSEERLVRIASGSPLDEPRIEMFRIGG